MTYPLHGAILAMYPAARPDVDFQLRDIGQGPVIYLWSPTSLGPIPTDAELQAAWDAKLTADAASQYLRDRATAYGPVLTDHLEALAQIIVAGAWPTGSYLAGIKASIQAIHTQYPPPA